MPLPGGRRLSDCRFIAFWSGYGMSKKNEKALKSQVLTHVNRRLSRALQHRMANLQLHTDTLWSFLHYPVILVPRKVSKVLQHAW